MKYFVFIILISFLFTSCCHFSSGDCCNPPEPFFVESTKEWIKPDMSQELIFVSQDTTFTEKTIYNFYSNENFYIGGDECGTDYPSFSFDYKFNNDKYGTSLISVRAVMDLVRFTIDPYSFYEPTLIAEYKVLDNQFEISNEVSTSVLDTLIGNLHYQKVKFKKLSPSKESILFNELTYIKGVGVISYVDTLGVSWLRK